VSQSDGHHLPGLDALRAVAVVAVVAFHLGMPWAQGGYLGVSLFFTLSGFLIARNLLIEHDRAGSVSLRAFWGRRMRRLWPAAWATIVVLTVVAVAAPAYGRAIGFRPGDALAALGNVANWQFLSSGSSYASLFEAPSPLLHFWSLAIEEQAYLVLPLLVVACLRRGRSPRALAVVAAGVAAVSFGVPVLFGWSVDRTYYGTDSRIGEILVGVVLAAVLHRRASSVSLGRTGPGLAVVGVAAFAALVVLVPQGSAAIARGLLPGVAAVSVVLVLAALDPAGAIARVGRVRPVAWVGRVSYGIYLFHWPLVVMAREAGWSTTGIIATVAVAGGAVLLAWASMRYVEGPIRGRTTSPRVNVLLGTGTVAVVVSLCTVWAPAPTVADDLLASLQEQSALLANTVVEVAATDPTAPTTTTTPGGSTTPTAPTATAPTAPTTTVPTVPAVPTVRFFGDSILLSAVLSTSGEGLIRPVVLDGDVRLGCGIVAFTEPGAATDGADAVSSCSDAVPGWAASIAASPVDAVVMMSCQWESVDRDLPGAGRVALGDPAFDDVVRVAYTRATDQLLDAGARAVLWVRCPAFSSAVGVAELDPRFVASRDPARAERLAVLIDEVVAARPGRACVVDLAGWVSPRIDDASLRPDGSHFEWRTPTGIGLAFAALVSEAWNACTG
jgi:peptidoglycan/LPS O-acetylase OafA/YrhL